MLFFGDDHGGEAMVGCSDAYWASVGSAVTNSSLLSTDWVVGAVVADRNAPALGRILNQHGAGNSTGGGMIALQSVSNGEVSKCGICNKHIFLKSERAMSTLSCCLDFHDDQMYGLGLMDRYELFCIPKRENRSNAVISEN